MEAYSNVNGGIRDTLRKPDGSTVATKDALEGIDALGLYFSAHWCPPCRGFTPKCGENYNALKAAGKKVEIIFCSSDKTEDAFNEYHNEMPWLALPYSERAKKESLAKRYKCKGIPYLVFVDPKTWETITLNGRGGITASSFVEDFPYHPKSSYDLSQSTDGLMGGKNVFIVFTDSCDAETKKNVSTIVRQFADKAKSDNNDYFFKYFTANGDSGIEVQMRPSFKMPEAPSANNDKPLSEEDANNTLRKPSMFVLNFSARKFWVPAEGQTEVTLENIQALLDCHKNGSLKEDKL